ncbi:27 kDa hemolymph protein-like [Diabrotica undecimpunctata]|uniref:27 kDa hemolymph protein-like n=1 Tax=Diabrotica undecimpunctata TaxID=50387 RepID=UPI003B63B024
MNLLGKALVFVLMGCAYTQNNFGQPDNFGNLNQPGLNFGNGGNSPFGNGRGDPFGSGRNEPDANAYLQQAQLMLQQLPVLMKQKCEQAGHPEVIQSLQQLYGQTEKCLESKVNFKSDEVSNEFAGAARTGELPNFFKKYCKLWPDIHGCINPFVTSIEKCFESDEKRTVDKTLSLVDDSNTFFCENNADRIMKLLNGGAIQCLETVGKDIQGCANTTMQKRQKQQSSKKALFAYDEETCSDFQSGRKCITSKLTKCESKDPSKIVDDYLALVQDKVCSSASSLSWFSFANILLLVGTYLYSKMF